MIKLRPYQTEAMLAVEECFYDGHRCVLVVMATGLGKTTLFVEIARSWQRVLVLAHRRELIDQAYNRFKIQSGVTPGIELASLTSNGEAVVVGSVQTMLARLRKDAHYLAPPDLIIIDEAHHAVSPTYQEVLNYFPASRVLGVTATPDRADKIALGNLFSTVAYNYETTDAIRDGWLAPIIEEKANLTELVDLVEDRRTIIFTTNVAEAIFVSKNLPRAAYVHGAMPKNERKKIIDDYKQGLYQFLVNCNILTEGFDCPEIECVAMLRATESRALFVQCLGRGLRLAPGKEACLFVDLTVDMPEHSLACPTSALEGAPLPAPVPVTPKGFWDWFYSVPR